MFDSGYNVTENSDHVHRRSAAEPRRLTVVAAAIVASVMSGVGTFTLLTSMRPVENRVTWALQPPKVVKTTARSVLPARFLVVSTDERGS